jgi:hypothetical protein
MVVIVVMAMLYRMRRVFMAVLGMIKDRRK